MADPQNNQAVSSLQYCTLNLHNITSDLCSDHKAIGLQRDMFGMFHFSSAKSVFRKTRINAHHSIILCPKRNERNTISAISTKKVCSPKRQGFDEKVKSFDSRVDEAVC